MKPSDVLDRATSEIASGSKLGLNATKKAAMVQFVDHRQSPGVASSTMGLTDSNYGQRALPGSDCPM